MSTNADGDKYQGSSDDNKNKTLSQKGKKLFRKYGVTFVGTYGSIYLATLFTLFLGVDSGILSPDQITSMFEFGKDVAMGGADCIGPDGSGEAMGGAADAYRGEVSSDASCDRKSTVSFVTDFIRKWDWTAPYADAVERNPHVANLAVAWFMVKFTEPIRLGLAIAIVPRVARFLGPDERYLRRDPPKEKKL